MADERNRGPDIPHGTDEENSRIGRESNTKSRVENPRIGDPRDEDPAEGRTDIDADRGNPPRTA